MPNKSFETQKVKDYVNYTPENVKFLNQDEMELVIKYEKILGALRKKTMTVKEIHDLYYDSETKKHTYTLKTIYRYLEALEEAGLVVVAGHRDTKGSRKVEKLYTKSAIIFFQKKDDEYLHNKKGVREKIVKQLYTVLGEILQKRDINYERFSEIMLSFFDKQHYAIDDVVDSIMENQTLAELFSEMDPEYISAINTFSAVFITLLENPKILDELKKLYDLS